MTMAIVTARYPELQRRARTVSAAIMLGQARRRPRPRVGPCRYGARRGDARRLPTVAGGAAGMAAVFARARG